jgi:hypothetical protein
LQDVVPSPDPNPTTPSSVVMTRSYKPAGYTSVAPYLTVNGGQRTINFLKCVFGGVELRRFDGPGVKDPGGTRCWIGTQME